MRVLGACFLSLCLLPVTAFGCDEKLRTYSVECSLQDEYRELRSEFAKHNIQIEQLTKYRALRFIDANAFAQAAQENQKVEDIYKPAPLTWDRWNQGERLAKEFHESAFYLAFLNVLHSELMSTELMGIMSRLKGNIPGQLRTWQINPAFYISCDDAQSLQSLKIFLPYDLTDFAGDPLLTASLTPCSCGSVRNAEARDYLQGWVYYIDSEKVLQEIMRWLNATNSSWADFLEGKESTRSPLEFIADTQRWFISIHPYGDGNGRLSRLLQDILLRSFDLPFLAAGELQKDLQLPKLAYRQAFISTELRTLEDLRTCLEEYRKGGTISYACKEIP